MKLVAEERKEFLPQIVLQGLRFKGKAYLKTLLPFQMSIKVLFWNLRGIGNLPSLSRLKLLIRTHGISLIALFEPWMDKVFRKV